MLDKADLTRALIDFEARYGRSGPVDTYFAPGRVNLIGEHTDYNGGYVLPMAIQQGTYLIIRPSSLPPARLFSENLKMEARIITSEIKPRKDWADYVRGVCLYAGENCGDLPPFDAMYFGDLKLESGLSSSASIEVVTAMGLATLGCELGRNEMVKVSYASENTFVGVSSGVMDQFTVAFGKEGNLILLNCETMQFKYVPFNLKDVVLVVGHTGVRRALTDSEYNQRRLECEEALEFVSKRLGPRKNLCRITPSEFEEVRWSLPEVLAMRAEHVVFENVRAEEAARCVESGDAETLGYLMNRSHESLRDLYEVSCAELDELQRISVGLPGVWGCRMTGAGFGGCVIALVQKGSLERYLRHVPAEYWKATHYDAEFVVVTPGEGARPIQVVEE